MQVKTMRRRIDQLGQNAALDRFVEPLRQTVHAVLRDRRVKDALHGVWLGHPLHPALSDLPIGMWTSAGLLDLTGTNPRTAAAFVLGRLEALLLLRRPPRPGWPTGRSCTPTSNGSGWCMRRPTPPP